MSDQHIPSDPCLSCGKSIKPGRGVWLSMHCTSGEFTDSDEVAEEWGDMNQGAFVFGADCAKKVLKDGRACEFKGSGG